MADAALLKKEIKKLKGMLKMKEEINEIKSLLKDFKGMAANVRAESAYLMDRVAKDRMAKRLLPYYPFFIEIVKRSGVLVTGDSFKSALMQINASFSNLDEKVKRLELEVDNIKRRSLYGRISGIYNRLKRGKGD